MIKAVFFDVDHTLFSHSQVKVPDSSLEAIARLQEKGIKVILATGRALVELNDLHMENIPFDGYVLCTGQLCLDKDHNYIYGNALDEDDVLILRKLFEEKTQTMIFVEKDRFYINVCTETFALYQQRLSSRIPPVEEYHGAPLYQACYIGEKAIIDEVLPALKHVKPTNWNYDSVDLVSVEGGKANGIRQMMKAFDLKKEEVMAFGDAENDIDMLMLAGTAVCMGKGSAETKAVADYVTDDIDHDGVYNALKHFNLI